MDVSCEYSEKVVVDSKQGMILQSEGSTRSFTASLCKSFKCYVMYQKLRKDLLERHKECIYIYIQGVSRL